MSDTTRIDGILAALPADQRAALQSLREGFDTSKGTVRFTPDNPLPTELVAKIVRARIAESDARWGSPS